MRRNGSISRDDRTAEVEAPDEFAANGLNVLVRAQRVSRWDPVGCEYERKALGTIIGEPIFGLPEEARQEADAVFIAGSEKPALVPLAREERSAHGTAQRKRKRVNFVKLGFSIT